MRARLRQRIGDEAGLTIIEVLIASVVLVLGAAASFGVLASATKNSQRAKATQVSLDLAQQEMERLRTLEYDELAIDRLPTATSNPKDPNSRISEGLFALKRGNPNQAYFPLVVDESGATGFSPESEVLPSESEVAAVPATVYRYVVWRNDPSCTTEECEESLNDYKQLVVAVKPERPVIQGGESGYVEVQSAVTDPEFEEEEASQEEKEQEEKEAEEKEEEEGPGGGGPEVTAQQFFLTDTSCAASGTTVRQEITADHLLHNTLGTCASGPQTGETLGAPDALTLASPPDPFPEDETLPLLYDYADDFYLEPTPDTDKGVQIRRDDTSGCHYEPTGTANPESQVHRWVTDPMPKAFEMNGKATLEFYTRTLNDALYTGTLCVYLFERVESVEGGQLVAEDTMLIDTEDGNPYWVYRPEGNGYWPRNSWAKVRLPMEFHKTPPIAAGRRLGVALSVDRANTPADAIPVMYDHPNFPTRLEVETDHPLEVEEEGG